ncbi:MAG: metal ABC transporter substrate-binding protein [Candidatus Marinamargulisbacteria bacterium]
MYFNKLTFAIILCCFLWGGNTINAKDKVKIVTVNDDFASIAKAVGGDHVVIYSLVNGSRNMHDIKPKPSMVVNFKGADMLIRLGMSQDAWVDGLILVARNSKLFPGQVGYLDASENIQKLEVPTADIDGSQGDIHIEGNPHYWLNPKNGIVIANSIYERLIKIDSKNQTAYSKNLAKFTANIEQKMIGWQRQLQTIKTAQFLTYHGVWSYFFDAFGLTSAGTMEMFPGVPPTVNHLKTLKNKVKSSQHKTIVVMANFYPKTIGQSFATDIDAEFKYLATNVGDNNIDTYIQLFDYLVMEMTK